MRLKNQTAIVTGGASGIGQAICEVFAEEGARVIVADYDEASGMETARQISANNGNATFIQVDVADEESVKNLMNETVKLYTDINILVNNAGICKADMVTETKQSDLDRMLNINLKGVIYCCKHALPHMIKCGQGSIVNVASVLALVASPNQAAYTASKGGVVSLTRQIAYDYADRNIRANCICPGDTKTSMFHQWLNSNENPEETLRFFEERYPMKRFAEPREQATTALFFASEDASFVTGQVLAVDGGFTMW